MYRKKKPTPDRRDEVAATAPVEGAGEDASARVERSAAETARIQRDFAELEMEGCPKWIEMKKPENMFNFTFVVAPDDGYWKGGRFEVRVDIREKYPFTEPIFRLLDKIYHPAFDYEGRHCIGKWKPAYTVQTIMSWVQFVFAEPSPYDGLNDVAAKDMRTDKDAFARNVLRAMNGLTVGTESFPKNKGTGYSKLDEDGKLVGDVKDSGSYRRIQFDLANLEPLAGIEMKKPDDMKDLSTLHFLVSPTEGYWKGGRFEARVDFPASYPFKEPRVRLLTKIYHPAFGYDGNHCMFGAWKPTYNLQMLLIGLLRAFAEPSATEAVMNFAAANELLKDKDAFALSVLRSLHGVSVGGEAFTKNQGTGFGKLSEAKSSEGSAGAAGAGSS